LALNRCGPRKLAKAFAFCLNSTPHPTAGRGNPLLAFGIPTEGLSSQSLFDSSLGPLPLHRDPQARAERPFSESIIPSQASERHFTLGSKGVTREHLNPPRSPSSEPLPVKQPSAGTAIPTTLVSVANQAQGLVIDVDKPTRQRPNLLLVEDNPINLKVWFHSWAFGASRWSLQ